MTTETDPPSKKPGEVKQISGTEIWSSEEPVPRMVMVDTALLNDPGRLRERAAAIEAAAKGLPVDKWHEGKWFKLKSISAFFYGTRYRARPSS